jgi:hypothetical protein
MPNKTGANEPCVCGSGQKYKRCCRDKFNKNGHKDDYTFDVWDKNAKNSLIGFEHEIETRMIFFALLDFIKFMNWRGACYPASVALTVLFREIGLNAVLCIGNVEFIDIRFTHSWVEVDGKIFDATIWMQGKHEVQNSPVVADRHLETGEKTTLLYGIGNILIEPHSSDLLDKSFSWLMSFLVESENAQSNMTVWDVLGSIAHHLKMPLSGMQGEYIDKRVLLEKYKDVKMNLVNRYTW